MGRKRKSDLNPLFLGVFILIGLAIKFWYLAVPALIGFAFLLINSAKKKAEETQRTEIALRARENQENVLLLVEKLKKDLEYAKNGKSLKTRLNNCEDALAVLAQLDSLDASDVVINKAEMREEVLRLRRISPILELIEKLNKSQFTRDIKREEKILREILYNIKANEISDADLATIQTESQAFQQPLTFSALQYRVDELERSSVKVSFG